MSKGLILVVEDEEDLREILEFNLRGEGYRVTTCASAEEALKQPLRKYDLLLLDIMLDGMSGLHLAEQVRGEMGLEVPIIFLTARDSENDLVTGFNIGADDYVKKPFSIKELLVRIRAVLARTVPVEVDTNLLEGGGVIIDLRNKTVEVNGEDVRLTKKEFDILVLLMEHKGEVMSREQILHQVWPDGTYVLERTVDVHIARIRKKLGEASHYMTQRTGFGYCFEEKL